MAMFKRIDHIGIVVNNLDDSLKTYCDQLGFTLLERVRFPNNGWKRPFWMPATGQSN